MANSFLKRFFWHCLSSPLVWFGVLMIRVLVAEPAEVSAKRYAAHPWLPVVALLLCFVATAVHAAIAAWLQGMDWDK
jgi:hypothetical protein